MSFSLDPRITNAAARGRARLEAGERLHELLRVFREDDALGPLESILALKAIEPVDLGTAKILVETACSGHGYAHLGLEDLARLVAIGRLSRCWLGGHLRDALIDQEPWRLFVPGASPSSISFYTSRDRDPKRCGSISGHGVSFAKYGDEARAAVMNSAWASEVEIVRDSDAELLVRFRKVRARADRSSIV
jgi:hypothetical protein